MKKVLKILLGLFLLFVVLVGGLLIFVQFFFPNETVRKELEARLSEQVRGTVTIQSLTFNILSGLHVRQVDVMKYQKRVGRFDDLILDYNIWHLLRGTLVLNEVRLTRVDLDLDLEDFESQPTPEASHPKKSSTPPLIPLLVDLQNFSIRESNILISRGQEFSVVLKNLDLQAALGIGLQLAELSGTVEVGQGEFTAQGTSVHLPLQLTFALSFDHGSELLTISAFKFRSGDALQVSLSGTVKQALSQQELALTVSDGKMELGPTLDLFRGFLPPDLAIQQLTGTMMPSAILNGSLLESGFEGTVRLDVRGEQIQARFPAAGATLLPTNLTLRTPDLLLHKGRPQSLNAELQVTGEGVQAQDYRLTPLDLNILAEHTPKGSFSGSLDLQGQVSTPPLPSVGSMTQPLDLHLTMTGDIPSQTFSLSKAQIKVKNLLSLMAKGHVGPVQKEGGHRKAILSLQIEPQVEPLLSLFPQAIKGDLKLRNTGDSEIITVEAKGDLDSSFLPQTLQVNGDLHLAGISASSQERGTQGLFNSLDLQVDGTYMKDSGSLKGTITSDVLLSGMEQKGVLAIGKGKGRLVSRFQGTVSPDYHVTRLLSQDRVTIDLEQFRYHASNVTARVPILALRSNSKAHLLTGQYQLYKLEVSSGTAFRLQAQGQYHQQTQGFVVNAKVPYLNIGQVLQYVSGKPMPSISKGAPRGRLSLSLKSSGTLPDATAFNLFHLPATLSSQVNLKEVALAVQGHQIVGANGAIAFSVDPQRRQLVKAFTDVHIGSLNLAPGYPLSRASNVFANLDLDVEAFDRMRIHDAHFGFDGAMVSLKGTVHGLRDVLEGKPQALAKSLGPLFAKLESQVALDLGKMAKVLEPFGMTGSGQSDLSLTLLKKEKGPIDAQVHLNNRHLSLIQKETKLVNLQGGLSLRKRLQWEGDPRTFSRLPSFSPTTVLPKLQSFSTKAHRVRIERLEINGLTVSNLTGGIQFDRDRLIIRNLAMDFLRGGLGGNVLVKTGHAFSVTSNLEAAGLDLHALLDSNVGSRGDSLVDGIVDLSLYFGEQKGRLDFGQSRMNVEFPKIGRDSLDRLLRFLDPTGSNPSIVGVRATVKLANPSKVRLTLNRGLLGLTIKFQNRLIPDFPLPRIPVGRIKEVQEYTDTIPQWERIREVMQLLGATKYGVDQHGHLALQ